MILDRNGNELKIGDRVVTHNGNFEFTIEVVVNGWVWGSDMPFDEKYTNTGGRNYYNPHFLIRTTNYSWTGNRLLFNFR